jgi:hypothetical protein
MQETPVVDIADNPLSSCADFASVKDGASQAGMFKFIKSLIPAKFTKLLLAVLASGKQPIACQRGG